MATLHRQETATTTLTEQVIEAATRTATAAGTDARNMARRCLIDWFGCTLRGASEPLVNKLVASSLAVNAPGPFPLVGRAERMGLFDMALINGAASHALDYDDGLTAMMGHPSAPMIPALLAASALVSASGAELVEAIILAFDVAGRAGRLLVPDHYNRGFHGTATAGALGAAAGCAHLMKLGPAERASALGLAGTRAMGLKASFGTEAKPLHAGWAALVGVTAAHWAQQGFIGATDIFGHRTGLRAMSENFNPEAAVAEGPPLILGTNYKYHAACHGTHATLEAVLAILREEQVGAPDIAEVVVAVDSNKDTVCNQQVVETGLAAKFSLRMVTAMVLAGVDTADPDSFSDALVRRPDVRAQFDRVRVDLVDGMDSGASTVTLRTRDGRAFTRDGEAKLLGAADADRAVTGKFLALARPVLGDGRATALKSRLDGIESEVAVLPLLDLSTAPNH